MFGAYILAAVVAMTPPGGLVTTLPYSEGVLAAEAAVPVRLDVYTYSTPEQLEAILPEDIRHLAADVIRICEREDVNARFIAALMRWERRPDLHNYFGWTTSEGKLKRFEDDLDCLERVIPLIKKLYLTPGGRYYHGATVEGVSVCYNNTDLWREAIAATMEGMG